MNEGYELSVNQLLEQAIEQRRIIEEGYMTRCLSTHEKIQCVSVVEQVGFLQFKKEGRGCWINFQVNTLGFRKGTIYLSRQRSESFHVKIELIL